LFAEGLCRNGGNYGEDLLCAYNDNLVTLRAESSYDALHPYEHIIAAMLTMSTPTHNAMSTLGLTGTYTVFSVDGVEPFSPSGDPDGDGLTNTQEYVSVLTAQLGRAEYVIAALTPNSGDGEGPTAGVHKADQNGDMVIQLTELLRVIQFFNTGGYHCADVPESTEDGYLPGTGDNHSCAPHTSDYNPQNWKIELTELLRLIQFFNTGGYHVCDDGTEDGFCVGPPAA